MAMASHELVPVQVLFALLSFVPPQNVDLLSVQFFQVTNGFDLVVPDEVGTLIAIAYGIGYYFEYNGLQFVLSGSPDLNSRKMTVFAIDVYFPSSNSQPDIDLQFLGIPPSLV